MRLTIREDSTNYACTVVKLPVKQKVEGLDNLVKVTVFGNDVLTKKDADENQLYLFFPAECAINAEYLSKNNEFRESTLNIDCTQTGYFEPSGRVKAIKFKGVISTGYLTPLSTLASFTKWGLAWSIQLKVGDEFTTIDGIDICKKYIPKHVHTQGIGGAKESKHNKKLKRFDKLVPNQFRFHNDTSHLAKNLHLFNPDDIVVITDKWHGTSTVHSNILINKQLTIKERIAKWFGVNIVDRIYDNIYSSRSVVKNQYINKEVGPGYYKGEDIWGIVNKELEGKIEQGITLYGEIVGYLPSGRMIQKGYDYGCSPGMIGPMGTSPISSSTDTPEHKFLAYRITYTKPNGEVIEYSWNMIKEYCKKYSIEHVKQLYFGRYHDITHDYMNTASYREEGPVIAGSEEAMMQWKNNMFNLLCNAFLEKDCTHCRTKVPAEGICVRIDGKPTYSTFKLKSKRFLEHETKAIDKGEVSIEDEQQEGN